MSTRLGKLATAMILLFSLSYCSVDDGYIEINNSTDFEEYIGEEMEDQKIPAMSVLIFKGEEVLYDKYFGNSNLENETSLEGDHLFLMASVSKVVTATALLQLFDDGLFGLDDKINDYLPFSVAVPNQSTDITFRMLLTHTSGIEDGSALDDQYFYGQDPNVALGDFLEDYLSPNGNLYNTSENFYNFEPGTRHEYSNIGNALIGHLVEEISGIEFNAYCKANIFSPLGMNNTFWRLDEISQTIVTPYNYENGQYQAVQHYTFTDYPNGGLRSTGTDMFKFLNAFTQGGMANNHALLSTSTVAAMITPQIPAIDNEVGLHMFLMNAQNGLWGHDGGEEGVVTIMAFNPTTKVGAIVLSNQGEADLDEILVEAYKVGLGL